MEAFDEVQLIGLTDSRPVDINSIHAKVRWTHIGIKRLPIPIRFLLSLGSPLPASCHQFKSKEILDRLLSVMSHVFEHGHHNVVIFEDLPLAITFLPLVRERFPSIGVAIRSENVFSKIFYPLTRQGEPLSRLAWGLELTKIRRAETEACKRADRVWAISDQDSQDYLALLGIRCDGVFGVSVNSDRFSSVVGGDSQTVVFVGGVDLRKRWGIRRFIKDAWPIVRAEVPLARFVLAGRGSEKINNPSLGIYGLGYVADDQAVWAQGQIALNPQEFGSGIKLKSIIAMLCARALVSTETGVEGIAGENGKHFFSSPTAGSLAPLVIQLMKNPFQAIEIGQMARGWATEMYARERLRRSAAPLLEDFIRATSTEHRGTELFQMSTRGNYVR